MDPISSEDRRVANLATAEFKPFLTPDGKEDGEVLQVNGGRRGYGFHIYRMAPGATTEAHTHIGDEEFYLIDGDLTEESTATLAWRALGVEQPVVVLTNRPGELALAGQSPSGHEQVQRSPAHHLGRDLRGQRPAGGLRVEQLPQVRDAIGRQAQTL